MLNYVKAILSRGDILVSTSMDILQDIYITIST